MMEKSHKFSIVVPVRNLERTISRCLDHLLDIDYPDYEIIITDGGSTDGTLEIIRGYQQRNPGRLLLLEYSDCPGPSQARNTALKKAGGDYIAFTDADCAPCREWLKEFLRVYLDHPQVAGIVGHTGSLRTSNRLAELYCEDIGLLVRKSLIESLAKEGLTEGMIEDEWEKWGATANMSYRRAVVEQVGGLDEDYGSNEDVDLGRRIGKAGYGFYFNPKALVRHMHRITVLDLIKQQRWWAAGGPQDLRKHGGPRFKLAFPLFGRWPAITFKTRHTYVELNLGYFYLMHIYMLLTWGSYFIFGWAQGWGWLTVALFVLATYCVLRYFALMGRAKRWWLLPAYWFIRYSCNWGRMIGFLQGCWKHKVLWLERQPPF